MDRLQAMTVFVQVADIGSFARAADSLKLPRATVTRLVQALETHLRTRLLHRSSRRVALTAEGEAYRDHARRVLADVEAMEGSLQVTRQAPRGKLRVDVPGVFGRLVLIPALPDFYARYPEIQIDLGLSDRPADLIGDQIDCVVRLGLIGDDSLVARHVGDYPLLVCASPAYLKRYGVPGHPLDLAREPHRVVAFVSGRTGRAKPLLFRRGAEAHSIEGAAMLAINDGGANLEAGLAGLGVVRLPTLLAQPYLDRKELVTILPDWSTESLPAYVAYSPNRNPSRKLRAFIDWVIGVLQRSAVGAVATPSAPRQRLPLMA